MATSILTLGRKSTTYSAPRYSSVWPFCLPKPLTSVPVMPCTPMADRASRTSSSWNGLIIAVTSFIDVLPSLSECLLVPGLELVETLERGAHHALAGRPSGGGEHGVVALVPANFDASLETVARKVGSRCSNFLVLRGSRRCCGKTEAHPILVVERFDAQRTAELWRDQVRDVAGHAYVFRLDRAAVDQGNELVL